MRWRQNPQQVAWFILLTSFLSCCLLTVAVPLGARAFLLHSTVPIAADVTATAGTAQVWAPGADDPTAVTSGRAANEGSRIVTDRAAKALITILSGNGADPALSTIQLFQDSALDVQRARAPRFPQSKDPVQIELALKNGRVAVTTQSAGNRGVRVHLTTPQASIAFGNGAFDIIIQGDETQVRSRSGPAQILAAGTEVTANSGERVSVSSGSAPGLPIPGAQNLVLNGSFESRLSPAWSQIAETGPGMEPGKVAQALDGQRNVVRFSRSLEDGAHNVVGIQQVINRDVQGYDSLALSLDLKLLSQSVPGGGYLASEYPVMVDFSYTDVYGKDLHWYQGFYYLDLPPSSTWAQPNGEKAPLGIWYSYESPNLLELLKETRPARINSVTVYASGHDYNSMVSDVALNAR